MTAVAMRIEGGWAHIGPGGILLRRICLSQKVLIPWSLVMFVSPESGVRRHPLGWDTFRGEAITEAALADKLRFWSFQLAIEDRHALRKSSKFLTRFWLLLTLNPKPPFMANDRPHATQVALDLFLSARWVRRNDRTISRALDAFEACSRYDLLGSSDD